VVEITELKAQGDIWEATLKVREGVYRLDRYAVRVEGVPLPPAGMDEAAQEERVRAFVLARMTRHMRRGSLPPRATRLDGSTVWETPVADPVP
jgi:hypothetical protein